MDLSKYYGKPSGITLREHTDNVHRFGSFVRKAFPFFGRKYAALFGKDLDELCYEAEEKHDYGKAYKVWREACSKDVELYHKWLRRKGKSINDADRKLHQQYEEECGRQRKAAAPNLQKAGYRHEFASCYYFHAQQLPISPEAFAAIAAHHGKLSYNQRIKDRWREESGASAKERKGFAEVYNHFYRASYQEADESDLASRVLLRYRYAAVRALLQLADTRASRWEGMGDTGMVPLHRFQAPAGFGPGANLRPVQQAAVDAAGAMRTILRAPTGSGKTYASLLWAERQVLGDQPRADRLVIAMPTRFTSNALRNAVLEQMPEVGLYHSSAFFNLYGEDGDTGFGSMEVEQQKLARFLAYPVTVCTVDHLLSCLTGTKEYHYSTFFFLANSCVVFDETDFYDEFVQANLRQLLDVLTILKVPTLIMSATVPNSARELYRVDTPIKEAPQPGSELVHKQMGFTGGVNTPAAVSEFIDQMLEARQGIIYANTVARALDYYEYLQDRIGDIPLTLYHSRFTEPDKQRIEKELENSLGKQAHATGKAAGIVIMTQIGEMSINISSQLMLTDCCPWDRLAQRVGRLARFATNRSDEIVRAEVRVVEPINDKDEPYAWPYVTEEMTEGRSKFVPARAYAETLQQIRQLCATDTYRLTPENLIEHTNALYPNVEAFGEKTKANQDKYREYICKNWLLSGSEEQSDDESRIGQWQSRDIGAQVTIFTETPPDNRFKSWRHVQEFTLRYGVTCPVYKAEGELRQRSERTTAINLRELAVGFGERQEEKQFYFATEGAYDEKVGLASIYGYAWTENAIL